MIDVKYILVYGSMLFNMMPWHKLEADGKIRDCSWDKCFWLFENFKFYIISIAYGGF